MALAERIRVFIDAHTGGAVREFDKVAAKADQLGDSAAVGKGRMDRFADSVGVSSAAMKAGLATAAVAAAGALVQFGSDAAESASELEEQISATGVTFGTAAKQVEAFAETAAKRIGLSKTAALEATNTFGAFFTQIGLGDQSAGRLSVAMTTLAGDLASFKDVAGGTAAVAQDLRSGLSGEAEPLRKFGIFLDEAKVKSRALAIGLGGANRQLSDGEKILARYSLITEQAANAQGDFIRTQHSLANQQRIAAAQTENLKASLGALAVPVKGEVTGAFNDFLEVAGAAAGGMENLATVAGVATRAALFVMSSGATEAAGRIADLVRSEEEAATATEAFERATAIYNETAFKQGANSKAAKQALAELNATLPALAAEQDRVAQATKSAEQKLREFEGSILGAALASRTLVTAKGRVAEAARTVEDRERQLNDLLRRGAVDAKAVEQASRSLESARRGLASAEDRYAEARRRVEELRNPTADDTESRALSLERAQLRLADAEARLTDVRANAESTSRDITAAELDVRQARLDLNAEQRRGQEDARLLAAAERDLTGAEQSLTDAKRGLWDAQVRLNEAQAGDPDFNAKVAAAKRDLATAEDAVADAKLGVFDAASKLVEAQKLENEQLRIGADGAAQFADKLREIAALAPEVAGAIASATNARITAGLSAQLPPGAFAQGGFDPQTAIAGLPGGGGSPSLTISSDDIVAALAAWSRKNGPLPVRVRP